MMGGATPMGPRHPGPSSYQRVSPWREAFPPAGSRSPRAHPAGNRPGFTDFRQVAEIRGYGPGRRSRPGSGKPLPTQAFTGSTGVIQPSAEKIFGWFNNPRSSARPRNCRQRFWPNEPGDLPGYG